MGGGYLRGIVKLRKDGLLNGVRGEGEEVFLFLMEFFDGFVWEGVCKYGKWKKG
jgi:hypothetical protein